MQSQIVLRFSYPVYNRMLTSSIQTASLLVWRRVIASSFCLQASASCSFFKSCWRYFWASRFASSSCFCNVSLSCESQNKTSIVLMWCPLKGSGRSYHFSFQKEIRCKDFGTEQIRGSLSCGLETDFKKCSVQNCTILNYIVQLMYIVQNCTILKLGYCFVETREFELF